MSVSIKKRTVGAKTEGTPGTAETLAQSDYNLVPFNVSFTQDLEKIPRDYMVGKFAEFGPLTGKRMGTVSFSIHMANNDASNVGKLYAACGLTVSGSQLLLDDTNNFTPLTIEVADYANGASPIQKVHKFKGCSGKCKMHVDGAGRPVTVDFEFSGAFLGESDRAYNDRLTPTAFTSQTTASFLNGTADLEGVAMGVDKWTIDFGQELGLKVDPEDETGVQGYHVTGFKPRFTGDLIADIEATDGLYDAFAENTALELVLAWGSIVVNAPRVVIEKVSFGERNGFLVKNIEAIIARPVEDTVYESDTDYPITIELND